MPNNNKLIFPEDEKYATVSGNPFLYKCVCCNELLAWDALAIHIASDSHKQLSLSMDREERKIRCIQCDKTIQWNNLAKHLVTADHSRNNRQQTLFHVVESMEPDVPEEDITGDFDRHSTPIRTPENMGQYNHAQLPAWDASDEAERDMADDNDGKLYCFYSLLDGAYQNVCDITEEETRDFLYRNDPDAEIEAETNAQYEAALNAQFAANNQLDSNSENPQSDTVEADATLQTEMSKYFKNVTPSDPYFPYKSKAHAWIHMIASLPRQVCFWVLRTFNR
jgi:hypothetical protein